MKFRNETERRECREKLKWGVVVVAFLLLAVAVAAACTQGFKDGDPYNWFGTKDEQSESADNLIVSPAEEQGVSLAMRTIARDEYDDYGIAPTALSAQTITATVTNNGELSEDLSAGSWSYDWTTTNAGKNVTDYVTFSENGLTLTVSCIQAFTVSITVKYTSMYGGRPFATCVLDYVKPLKEVTLKILGADASGNQNMISAPMDFTMDDSPANQEEAWTKSMFEVSYVYGEGSFDNRITTTAFTVQGWSSSMQLQHYNNYLVSGLGKNTPKIKTTAVSLPKGASTSINDLYCALTGAAESELHKLGVYHCFSAVGSESTHGGNMIQLMIDATPQYGAAKSIMVRFDLCGAVLNLKVNVDNGHIYFSE